MQKRKIIFKWFSTELNTEPSSTASQQAQTLSMKDD